MRLIDADELLKKEHDIHVKEIGYKHRCIDASDVLNAPTIDAIPLSVIMEKVNVLNRQLDYVKMLSLTKKTKKVVKEVEIMKEAFCWLIWKWKGNGSLE